MEKHIEKELKRINKKEKKINKKIGFLEEKINSVTDNIESKIPDGLRDKIEAAFCKGFELIFKKGEDVINKTYDKKGSDIDFRAYRNIIDKDEEALIHLRKKLDKSLRKDMALTAFEGTGLGVLGIGLPDIPVFIGVVLRSIYKIASTYGFEYNNDSEKCYILKLVTGAMLRGEDREKIDREIERMEYLIDNNILECNINFEVKKTAGILADELLTFKFIQGFPIVGIVGGYTNLKVLGRIVTYSHLKYEKRCLKKL